MRLILQKVTEASVSVDGEIVGQIDAGYLLFLGILHGDTAAQAELIAEKIVKTRLFDSADGKINDQSILDTGGSILVVSQFTLAGRLEKGNRPDYSQAESPDAAKVLYEYFIRKLEQLGVAKVESGEFGAYMDVTLKNDGPVTLILER
ncbi:MAG: D-tyrosyl-tRNA(Tyr) deacylase [Candidatus Peribacter sp.]|jgi:D-aminoacyl-tRNA deacylase|nr:D-tyrosyl-tRNA(Tyr) deacylase [Candidatus Peribacter sp.]MBT4393390.1 D-tyrosyl-tRNA(Tyr) deacylase [Candidatus Peribacter sp.]MBT4600771.1 D-tyrosyl-tRNA(Tyr) deacylase [Candidatus Peribacter sp.]MBT5149183.1 D-tyrosyl-tRNA(Tyr) deacylase [Candidatus Peribacter sp.]MBT5637844.1 D-tyrosyl-tRNA(Tyr) deacylase [Candidatus Peribacter sp.]